MIRILHCVNIMDRAGLETMLMNYYRNMDRSQIQFDFLTHRPNKGAYDDEIEKLGGIIYHAPRLYPQNYLSYFRWMHEFFNNHHEYTIVHSHIDSMSYLPLLAAKRAGVPVRIAHSHNTKTQLDFKYPLKQYFRLRINEVCNYRFACGQQAGKYLFGDHVFTVVPNAIDGRKFLFDNETRKQKREELELDGKFVVGHVGRFSQQKNHKGLIEIFNELLKVEPNSILLLVGVGEKEKSVKKQIEMLKITEKVRFLGNRSDVNSLYQAMDCFVLPSFFEGIPVVGVEAQFSDLPCLFSCGVPSEVKINEKCEFIPVNKDFSYWADRMLKMKNHDRKKREDLLASKYNIYNSIERLSEFYKMVTPKEDMQHEKQ